MKDINTQVTTYVEKKIPLYRHWGRSELREMIQFFLDLGQLITHYNSAGKLDGVLAFQLIDKPEDIQSWKNDFNAEGGAIVILASEGRDIRSKLVQTAMVLSGVRKWICFEGAKYNKRMRVLSWALAERMAS